MTSKQALDKVKLFVSCEHPSDNIMLCETDEYKAIKRDLEMLEILKQHLTIEENYYSQDNGSTKAIKLCISNCISIEEDDTYTDECYPNPEYDKLEEWLNNGIH